MLVLYHEARYVRPTRCGDKRAFGWFFTCAALFPRRGGEAFESPISFDWSLSAEFAQSFGSSTEYLAPDKQTIQSIDITIRRRFVLTSCRVGRDPS